MQRFLYRYFTPQKFLVLSRKPFPSSISTTCFTLNKNLSFSLSLYNNETIYSLDSEKTIDPVLKMVNKLPLQEPIQSRLNVLEMTSDRFLTDTTMYMVYGSSLIPYHMMFRLEDWFTLNGDTIYNLKENSLDKEIFDRREDLINAWNNLTSTLKEKYMYELCQDYSKLTISVMINNDEWRSYPQSQLTFNHYSKNITTPTVNQVVSFIKKSKKYKCLMGGVKATHNQEGGLDVFTDCDFKDLLYENKPPANGFMKGVVNLTPYGFVPFWITQYLNEFIPKKN
jgi:hypothetical protein